MVGSIYFLGNRWVLNSSVSFFYLLATGFSFFFKKNSLLTTDKKMVLNFILWVTSLHDYLVFIA